MSSASSINSRLPVSAASACCIACRRPSSQTGSSLKGAALLLMWLDEPSTDEGRRFLGFGDTSANTLKHVFVQLSAIESPEDGLAFLRDSVHVEAIREDQEYGGMRVKLMAMLGNVRIPLQVDVGAGDAIVPPPEILDYPASSTSRALYSVLTGRDLHCREDRKRWCDSALANSRMKDSLISIGWLRHERSTVVTMMLYLAGMFRAAARAEPWPRNRSNGGRWNEL